MPDGWACKLEECPPGLFVYEGFLGLKTQYHPNGKMEVYCNNGDAFWGQTTTEEEKRKLIVQPVRSVWENE